MSSTDTKKPFDPAKDEWQYDPKAKYEIRRYSTVVMLKDCRKFRDWNEDMYYTEDKDDDDPDILTDDDYVLVHDNYTVSKHSHANRARIWINVTPEWKDFCENELKIGHWS